MKKIIYLMSLSLALYSCEAPKSVTTTTVTNEDNKSIAIAKLMKGYVENNFDGGIIAENCIVRFNNIELGKKDFEVMTSDLSEDYVLINSDYRS